MGSVSQAGQVDRLDLVGQAAKPEPGDNQRKLERVARVGVPPLRGPLERVMALRRAQVVHHHNKRLTLQIVTKEGVAVAS